LRFFYVRRDNQNFFLSPHVLKVEQSAEEAFDYSVSIVPYAKAPILGGDKECNEDYKYNYDLRN
jgi:hypothetical protein